MRSSLPLCLVTLLAGAHLQGCGRSSLDPLDDDDLADPGATTGTSQGPGGGAGPGGFGQGGFSDGGFGQGGSGQGGGFGGFGGFGEGGCFRPQPERCDGADNDCNGLIDEGDPESGQRCDTGAPGACSVGVTFCANGGLLCQPRATPAPERCNGRDDDCDGVIDNPDAAGCTVFLEDQDRDGYGVEGSAQCLCAPRFPFTTPVPGDCEDRAPDVYPGAPELCNGRDDDCDGVADDDILLCGCVEAGFRRHSYLFCTTPSTWSAAAATCAGAGYALVSIADAAENNFVSRTASDTSTDRWWIGLNDTAREGVFVWQGGDPVTFTPWGPGEPNNSGGNEDCGQINRYFPDTTWNDEPCGNELFFVCEQR